MLPNFLSNPIMRRRLDTFVRNRRGFWSLWIFLLLLAVTVCAEGLANDKPLLVRYNGVWYVPVLQSYPETEFGGEFSTEADYRDPFVQELIVKKGGWLFWPPIPFSYDTVNYDLPSPAPAPPSPDNWLGTDDQGRDVTARLIYGFRISVLFGLVLTCFTMATDFAIPFLGVTGPVQGYPYLVSGKPLFSLPAYIPIIFECTILLSAFGATFGMFLLNMLPKLSNPLFKSPRFRRATSDRFFIAIEAIDSRFDPQATSQLLETQGAASVELIEDLS